MPSWVTNPAPTRVKVCFNPRLVGLWRIKGGFVLHVCGRRRIKETGCWRSVFGKSLPPILLFHPFPCRALVAATRFECLSALSSRLLLQLQPSGLYSPLLLPRDNFNKREEKRQPNCCPVSSHISWRRWGEGDKWIQIPYPIGGTADLATC